MTRGICDMCNGIFPSDSEKQNLCKECREKLDRYMKRIREYLDKNHHASVGDVSIDVKVPLKIIERLINDGSLLIVDNDVSVNDEDIEWIFNRRDT